MVAEAEGIRYYKNLADRNRYITRRADAPPPGPADGRGMTRANALTRYRVLVGVEQGKRLMKATEVAANA